MTVVIVGILASAILPLSEVMTRRAKEQELRGALIQIREAIDAYKKAYDEGHIEKTVGASGYPLSLNDLVDGVVDVKSPSNQKIYFLRRLPRDPMAREEEVPAEETWGKRSYESEPDAPQEGDDVFDVYSLSSEIGLNDIPYSKW